MKKWQKDIIASWEKESLYEGDGEEMIAVGFDNASAAQLLAAAPNLLKVSREIHKQLIIIFNELLNLANNSNLTSVELRERIKDIIIDCCLEDHIDNLAVAINKTQ